MPDLRRTPCVGICSTTYGDLVCRGCKRFAHEIVQWNGFEEDQRGRVWSRLESLRGGAVGRYARVTDVARLLSQAEAFRIPDRDVLSELNLAYEVLRRATRRNPPLADLGLEAADHETAAALFSDIEQELFARSLAHYERNFRTPAQ